MHKLLILIVLAGGGYWASQQHIASSDTRPSLPKAAAWRHTSASTQIIETAAILDNRWRVEITGGRRQIVAVFDGTSFATNHPQATAQQLDPRPALHQLYASLPSTLGIPIEKVGANDCWHFTEINATTAAEVWIDTKTRFVRKVVGRSNGSETTDTYELLPLDVEAESKRLFDTKHLRLVLSRWNAQSIDFPDIGFTITLPASSKWTVQRSDSAKGATPILIATSEDKKIVGTLVVADTSPETAKQREDYFTAVRSSLNRSGWTILRETDAPIGNRPGRYISARSSRDGRVQLTHHFFTNDRTYIVSSTIVADIIATELKERGSQFFGGISIRAVAKSP